MAGLHAPLSTLHGRPHDRPRMTRGQCGSLLLHCDGLAPSTPCRSPGAPCADPLLEPVFQPTISGVGPHQLDRWKEMLQPLQQEFGAGAIMDVRRMHLVLQPIALRINEQMALAALDL